MCSLTLALTGITTGLQMAGQYQQSRSQAYQYEAQADAAKAQAEAARLQAKYQQEQADAEYQNARIQNRKGEQIAEQYAQQQRQLDAKRRLVTGQQNAQAGASGIVGGLGSGLDIYNAGMDAWNEDSMNLLNNQRNSMYDNYLKEVNLRNSGNALVAQSANTNIQARQYDRQASNLRAQASAAKTAGNWAMVGTLLGGAASMYGMASNSASAAGGASSAGTGTAQMPTAAGYKAIAADTAFGGLSGYTPQTVATSWGGYQVAPKVFNLGPNTPKYMF